MSVIALPRQGSEPRGGQPRKGKPPPLVLQMVSTMLGDLNRSSLCLLAWRGINQQL
jgi:hypothetical protein